MVKGTGEDTDLAAWNEEGRRGTEGKKKAQAVLPLLETMRVSLGWKGALAQAVW